MTEFKHSVASSLKESIAALYPAATISEEEIETLRKELENA